MQPIKFFSFLFMCFSMSMILSACGSKGDLYQVAEPETEQKTTTKNSQQRIEESKTKP